MAFVESRLPVEIDYGSSFDDISAINITATRADHEYRSMIHPYVRIRHDIGFNLRTETWIINEVLKFSRNVGWTFAGFRVKHLSDYTTNNYVDAPTYNDQLCVLVSTGIYQITNWYGTEGGSTALRRKIFKPVTGTTLVGINNPITGGIQSINGWSVDTTNGQVTFTANQKTITAITKASQAVITVGASHGYAVNNTVYVSGVAGMTEMNGRRGLITAIGASTITVNINSTAFTTYTSGGQTNASPQAGESVRAGCEFDLPCRFETNLSGYTYADFQSLGVGVPIIELLNP